MDTNSIIKNLEKIANGLERPLTFMEVCGTHTVSAFRTGLRSLLPDKIRLLSGPGCPVCVTPTSYLDYALALSRLDGVVITTFGDMLRVPGTETTLESERARGADIRMIYSPSDALKLAELEPSKKIVFLGVGFETTTPAIGWTIKAAAERKIANFHVLCAHKTIPEAMEALLSAGEIGIDGFMCPGHVSVITGSRIYEQLCESNNVPCVVAGFEAADMALALEMLAKQVLDGRAEVEVEYARSVDRNGNQAAQAVCDEIFEKSDAEWRGLGVIPNSGLRIKERFAKHDARSEFGEMPLPQPEDDSACRCGDILRGVCIPSDCPLFGKRCTTTNPVGACMVSTEGACAAHYKYG
jgi:hydrogenase expression/formation protein HypD